PPVAAEKPAPADPSVAAGPAARAVRTASAPPASPSAPTARAAETTPQLRDGERIETAKAEPSAVIDRTRKGDKAASKVPLPPNVTALASTGKAATAKSSAGKPAALAEKRNRELMCLAKAVYFEARGESETGQLAVAQVVLNRVEHPFYPDNICGVVFQNQHRRNKCQFSFACDGRSDRPRNQAAWARAITLAKKSMHGTRVDGLGNSTHYHANYVNPRWAKGMVRLRRIGKHIFYRMRAWS
ncbi:MAG TPA: cell wall hydrolase, partial [Hyphomicrobiales bacterium]|nr:cell wall hydrolase [Hyphomicrobiales bacterium]